VLSTIGLVAFIFDLIVLTIVRTEIYKSRFNVETQTALEKKLHFQGVCEWVVWDSEKIGRN
jgi:hypothetical protein